jgi:chromate reductase, NAD(P)H dehydrogenase (quinone)
VKLAGVPAHLKSGYFMNNPLSGLPVRILAISGSLRRTSSNTTLIHAAADVAPDGIEVRIYTRLAELPPFNPDDDGDRPPAAVAHFRSQIDATAALLICSPEYAHGVPGVLKNALDWLVGSGEIVGKPIALVNASPRAVHAQASLVETLRVMSADLVDEASITIPLSGRTLDRAGIAADGELCGAIRSALIALSRRAVSQTKSQPTPDI